MKESDANFTSPVANPIVSKNSTINEGLIMKKLLLLLVLCFGSSMFMGSALAQLYPDGIVQSDGLTVVDLTAQGWTTIFYEDYGTPTSTSDVNDWRTIAGNGYVLLAGVYPDGYIIEVGQMKM